MSMSINQCDNEIEKITPPTGKLEVTENGTYGVSGYYEVEVNVSGGGGDCPDLSEDTVAPEKLLSGYTAHNAEGNEIVGTLTGMDFITCLVEVTNAHPSYGFQITPGFKWVDSSETIAPYSVSVLPGETKQLAIPQGYTVMYFRSQGIPVEITNTSTGVDLINNGEPLTIGSNGDYYMVRVRGANAIRSFTIQAKS